MENAEIHYGTLTEVMPLIDSFDILWWRLGANSVLQEAVQAEKPDVLNALLDHVSKQDRIQEEQVGVCRGMAALLGDPALLRPFLQHGVQPEDALDATLKKFDTQILKLLLKHGADVHQITDILMYHNDPLRVTDADGLRAITEYVRTLLDEG